MLSLLDQEHNTFLHLAVYQNSPKLLATICRDKIKLTQKILNAKNSKGATALGIACNDGNCEAGILLVEAGADVDKLSCGYHPAFLANQALSFWKEIKSVDPEAIKSMELLLVQILERSKVNHKGQSYYEFASRYHLNILFGTFLQITV